MKTKINTSFLLLMAVPLLLISCAKNDTNEKQDAANTIDENSLKTELVYCGTPITASLVEFGQSTSYGTVTIGNDATTLQIKYQLPSNVDLLIINPQLFVGTIEQFNATEGTINPDGTLYINASPTDLPINGGWINGGTHYWEYNIDLSTLPDCFIVVAYSRLSNAMGGNLKTVFGKTMLKTSGYYLDYCVQQCPPPPPLGGCETGYAYGENYANCFLNIPGVQSNNWGWSNGPIGAGNYSWPIYAGAGQCNIGNGTHVGTLSVTYAPPTATVTYTTFNGYELNATHLHVGNQILPMKKGKYTTAPGQFPYKHGNLNGATSDTFTINGLSGNIYVAAHSEVCDAD